jgi:hypothetical protein
MLISCHIPKTAGVSFATALQEAFGEQFYWDRSHEAIIEATYAENRYSHEAVQYRWLSRYRRPPLQGKGCIHGHFPLRKYLSLAWNRQHVFVVWLRDPLRWRISLYYYWKQNYPHPIDKFLNRIFDEQWDLERFCTEPALNNYHSRFLAWFPRYRINFIGVTENYASDLAYLSRRILRRELIFCEANQSKKPEGLPSDGGFSAQFVRRFEAANRVDYRNYRAARRASDLRAGTTRDCSPHAPTRAA